MPHHLLVREEGSDEVLGSCPLYLKVIIPGGMLPLIRLTRPSHCTKIQAAIIMAACLSCKRIGKHAMSYKMGGKECAVSLFQSLSPNENKRKVPRDLSRY